MTEQPYQVPRADLERAPELGPEVPDEVLKRIKNGWIAGLVSITITTVMTVIAVFGTPVLGLDAWAFIDVAVMIALAYGIYRRSRFCAVLMLLFFLLNKVLMWAEAGTPTGLPVALVFVWYYAQAIRGTFQYHRIIAARTA